ncbi:Protein translocase subunit SecA [Streptomyces hirsutus]
MSVLSKIMRAGEGKILRKLHRIAGQVNSIEEDFVDLSDAELRALTDEYKQRYADGESLDDLLPEAFATVREAAKRVLGQRHYDVQIMGGAALHMGYVAEMKTGEGKTLVGTLPAYLNALSGKGVHIITVNDYLAERDSEMMGRVHKFLGLDVGCILANMTPAQRREQYGCDITYGTNNEFGFDYLRDNMAWSKDELVQRGHNFAVVDEVDSILIDLEAQVQPQIERSPGRGGGGAVAGQDPAGRGSPRRRVPGRRSAPRGSTPTQRRNLHFSAPTVDGEGGTVEGEFAEDEPVRSEADGLTRAERRKQARGGRRRKK